MSAGERIAVQGGPPAPGVRLGPVRLHALTESDVARQVLAALAAGRGGAIVTVNLDLLRMAAGDPAVAACFEAADLRVADGKPLLWLARIGGDRLPERITGADLVFSLAAALARAGRRLYLMGGELGVAERAAAALRQHAPGLSVVGTSAPRVSLPATDAEVDGLVEALAPLAPDLVMLSFGSPKQELLAARLRERLPQVWWLGCGAGLAFAAGELARAPRWMQRLGLEWLFRLGHEPARLAHRYLVLDVPFGLRFALRRAGERIARACRPPALGPRPVIYFDGHCVLCNGFADFVLARDRAARFRLAALQGETARAAGLAAEAESETMIVAGEAALWRESDGVLAVLCGLPAPWPALGRLGLLVPRALRNAVYRAVARRRRSWFGERAACRVPAPGERERLLP